MLLTRWLTLRSLRTHPLRTLLSALGIILGVSALFAIQITNQTALTSLAALFAGTAGKTDLVISRAGSSQQGFSERIFNRIVANPEITAAAPSLQIRTTLAAGIPDSIDPLRLFGFDPGGFILYGIDPMLDPAVRDYTITRGVFLSSDLDAQEIVLVEDFASKNGLQVGNTVELITPDGWQEFLIAGLLAKEGAGQINNGAFGVIPLLAAQYAYHRSGELDQVDIVLKAEFHAPGKLAAVKASLQGYLGEDYTVTTPASQGDRLDQMLAGFSIGLNFMGGMALFVGGYLIYNAFSMTMVERTREFGLLRTLGCTRGQVTFQVMVEAVILGVLGSALGVLSGFGLAQGATRLLGSLLKLDSVKVVVKPDLILTTLLLGVSMTTIAALIPAWQAGRISPLEALRVRGVRRDGWLLRNGWMLGIVLLLISSFILVVNPFSYDAQFRLGSITVVLLFLGGTLLIPGSVGVWEKISRPFVRGLYGSAGQLGGSNIRRARLRTTLTVAALMVGIAMVTITQGMTGSFRGDLEIWIDAYIGGDLLVSSSAPMRPPVMRRIESIPGVLAVTPMRALEVTWRKPDGKDEQLIFMGIDPETYGEVTSFAFSDSQIDTQAAYRQLAGGNAVFISSVLAEKNGLVAGDMLRLQTRRGIKDFTIAAVVLNFYNQGLTIQGNWADMYRYFGTKDANAYLVKVGDGNSTAAVQKLIEDSYGEREHLSVVSNQSLIDQVMRLLSQAYSLFDAMAVIAVLVGVFGVVNTLTMNVVERTQEIGMLRSIGMTRGQTLGMVLAESAVMGMIGGVLGLGFGVVLTRIFLWSMTAMSGYKVSFILPVEAVWIGLLIALVVSQFAAILPASRAARTKILEAIHYE